MLPAAQYAAGLQARCVTKRAAVVYLHFRPPACAKNRYALYIFVIAALNALVWSLSVPAEDHRKQRVPRQLLVFLATLVVGLGITLHFYLERVEAARLQKLEALKLQANDYEEQVQRWLDLFLSLNKGLAAFFSASDYVSRSEFDAYIATAEPFTQLKGLGVLAFLEQVPANQLAEFRNNARQDYPNYTLKNLDPASSYYYPLMFGADAADNDLVDRQRGQDFNHIAAFRQALNEALNKGASSAAEVPSTKSSAEQWRAIAVFTPVYRPARTLFPPNDLHSAIKGFVYSTLILDQFIAGFKVHRFSQPLSVRVYLDRATDDRLLYQDSELADGKTRRLALVRTGLLQFAGHRLVMQFHQNQPEALLGNLRAGSLVLLMGVLLSAGAAFSALRLYRHMAALAGRSVLADQFSSFFQNHPFAVCSLDRQRRFIAVNPQMAAELGLAPSELTGQSLDRFLIDNASAAQRQFSDAIAGQTVSFQSRIRRTDGSEYDFAVILIPLQSHGAVGSVLCIAENITQRKRLEEKLFHQANYDTLTGVPNRAFFYPQLNLALARCRRNSGKLALMYLDIDEFKTINDTYGHDIGDAVIRMFAARVRTAVRASDLLARLGGDEFILMVEDFDTTDGLKALAEKLVQLMEAPFVIDNLQLPVRTSIGVSCARATASADDLVRQADRAMYNAKRAGRNRISIDASCH